MKKIGILFGQENTFPQAFVDKVNAMGLPEIEAEFVEIGPVKEAVPSGYSVIVDRISHDVPFYRAYLKNAVLTGTDVINNPFWWSADDKFFNYALAAKLGVAVPRTVIVPHFQMPPDTNDVSFRNQQFPYDWRSVFEYVGFPAFLKPHDGGGWKDVHHVHNPDDFFRAYHQSRDLCMTLQAAVKFREYFRCYVVGQREVRIMPYDPSRPHHERYVKNPPTYEPGLLERVERDALTLCRALGYDLNTVEFAVEDGVPYAIDFMNPAPDADVHSVGQENFDWIVDAVARLAVERAQANEGQGPELRWAALLGHEGELAGAAKKAAKKGPPPPKKAPAKKGAGAKEAGMKGPGLKGPAKKAPAKKTAAKKQAANASREESIEG
ncbi:ATP-grasp domain-containing protein [Terriglobus sp.]|uniref:ATP-grasp domain-containing protein n=1 Tax=Terriglobus sp. TaxID=1889013 RepID=UPI003B00E4CF